MSRIAALLSVATHSIGVASIHPCTPATPAISIPHPAVRAAARCRPARDRRGGDDATGQLRARMTETCELCEPGKQVEARYIAWGASSGPPDLGSILAR